MTPHDGLVYLLGVGAGTAFGFALDRFILHPLVNWHATHMRAFGAWRGEGRDPRKRTRRGD